MAEQPNAELKKEMARLQKRVAELGAMKANCDKAQAQGSDDKFERRRAEKAMADLVENYPMSIQIVDRNGFTLKVNPAHTLLFGSVPGPDFSIFDDLQKKSKELHKLVQLVKSGEIVHFPDTYYNTHDIDPSLPDVPLWLRGVVFPIKGSNNEPERFVLMHENITAQKNYEDALRKSEDKFRSMFHQSPAGTAIVGIDKRFVGCNTAMCDLFGYSENELIGRSITDVAFSDDIELGMAQMKQMLNREIETFTVEKRYLAKNGNLIWSLNSYRLLFDADQKPLYFMTVIQDITQRRQMEKDKEKLEEQLLRSQKMESVGTLAGGIAHDFNNILTAIKGYASLSRTRTSSRTLLYRDLKEISAAADRAASLTRQLLMFSRKQPTNPAELRINSVIESMSKILQRLIGEDVVITKILADDLSAIVTDVSRIEQVLLNLVLNARDAMPGVSPVLIKCTKRGREKCTS